MSNLVALLGRSVLLFAVLCSFAPLAHSEPAACLSKNPADWPDSAKPYVLVIADTSGSMTANVMTSNSCSYPNTRTGHLSCALNKAFKSYSGLVSFGVMRFQRAMSGCSNQCFSNCNFSDYPGNNTNPGCGAGTGETRDGGLLVVPIPRQSEGPRNDVQLAGYFDYDCTSNYELFADGFTPLNGALRTAYQYLSSSWMVPGTSTAYVTPLQSASSPGEYACRQVHVILIADGPDTCDSGTFPQEAAAKLKSGFVIGGTPWSVKVHVIEIGGGIGAEADQIAAAGGTVQAWDANNEAEISAAISGILTSILPQNEKCDNVDNNCNGCTDEGLNHFANVNQICCTWGSQETRANCLNNYHASITTESPVGDLSLLPCTTLAQASDPATWLCYNPGDKCDNIDNNAFGGTDENQTKCGNPSKCPSSEVCNGLDDDCDGLADEGNVCSGCTPSIEVCDGCDNDCDSMVDEGVASVPCGQSSPANCVGTRACRPEQPVGVPGGCVSGGGWGSCSNNPQSEVCDSVDNDCDGVVDDGVAPVPCVPAGTPPGLVYSGSSQCKLGTMGCGLNVCSGFVGPSPEVCDGIDNDCDGLNDEQAFGIGLPCGISQPPCTSGVTSCVNGALICSGGVKPQPEVCDGLDNDCDGYIDNGQLADGPPAGMNGCWTMPGNCCSFGSTMWCPPPGATCSSEGMLSHPCSSGQLVCKGVAGYQCQGGKSPEPEQCNGLDDDCSGTADDGVMPFIGAACGSDIGSCSLGTVQCVDGVLSCKDDTRPAQEICDLEDNDCDGLKDEDILFDSPCIGYYDMTLFPGDRSSGLCRQGRVACQGGMMCAGAVVPAPEVCDGQDNDCDGLTDESGDGPDGIDGSISPDNSQTIGSTCSAGQGVCAGNVWTCVRGKTVCTSESGTERCDGLDNNCDGLVDEAVSTNGNLLCGEGTNCVAVNGNFRCAEPCADTVPACPGGQDCVEVVDSFVNSVTYNRCIPRHLIVEPLAATVDLDDPHQGLVRVGASALDLTPVYPSAALQPGSSTERFAEVDKGADLDELPQDADENQGMENDGGGGCATANTASPLAALLVLAALLGLALVRRHGRGSVVALGALVILAASCSTTSGGHDIGRDDNAQEDGGDASYDDASLDQEPQDANQDSDNRPDTSPDGLPDTSPDASDTLDSDLGDSGEDADVSQCPDANLHSVETCGSCDNNCLDQVPPQADPTAAVCTWSGEPDEAGVCSFPSCIAGWVDADALEPGCEYQCTKTDKDETECNGIDDDCDKLIDEDVDLCSVEHCGACGTVCTVKNGEPKCESGRNPCEQAVCGIQSCVGGFHDGDKLYETGCEYECEITNNGIETCDNKDNDCNTLIDDTFDFYSNLLCGTCTNNCYEANPNAAVSGVSCEWSEVPATAGLCPFTACAPNYWNLGLEVPGCEYYCVKEADYDLTCDNYDDDCDGIADDEVDLCSDDNCGICGNSCNDAKGVKTANCEFDDISSCTESAHCVVAECLDGYFDIDKDASTGCEYACVTTGVEYCNGLDDDCDGLVDEEPQDESLGVPCYGASLGLCGDPSSAGSVVCLAGQLKCTGENLLIPGLLDELCNGVDDDCDGIVDNFVVDVGEPCGLSDVAPCALGTTACIGGKAVCIGNIDPKEETCNGEDDNCDGFVDLTGDVPPLDSVGPCLEPVPPPTGATSPCSAGAKVCLNGKTTCLGAKGPTSNSDSCGVDANCDGVLTGQPDLASDINNCGECGVSCYASSVHSNWQCFLGNCAFAGCQNGYYDLDNNQTCEYACTFLNVMESCNGLDDNCNGLIDENVPVPPVSSVCGVSPAATSAECVSLVTVTCDKGMWKCSFQTPGVCAPNCATAGEVCDDFDNNCNGLINENVMNFGHPCYSDDGLPLPGHGSCRTAGTMVCNGLNAVSCSAAKADCSTLPGGCTEQCDGIDNDCDGLVDENFSAKGTNSSHFVKPAVTKIGPDLWIYSYEASRPTSNNTTSGIGNGYFTLTIPGYTVDKTPACSEAGNLPWTGISPAEAEQVCTAMGGSLCTAAQWTSACQGPTATDCLFGYNPAGSACLTGFTGTKFCNLGPTFDFSPLLPFDQDGLLPGGSSLLGNCWADWSGFFGNDATTNKIYDVTGNLQEIVKTGTSSYAVMGGSYITDNESASNCTNSQITLDTNTTWQTAGFRCCFTVNPTL